MGQLEAALAPIARVREGAALVAEDLALEQRLRHGRAVDRHEGTGRAPRQLVQRAGHQLLAGAGLAVDQHRRGGGRGLLDQAVDILHGPAAADQPTHAPDVLHASPQDRDLVQGSGPVEGLLDQQPEPVQIHRLRQVVVSALSHRAHRGIDRRPPGEDDDRHPRHLLLQRAQEGEAVHVRHHEIGDDERGAHVRRFIERFPSLGRDVCRVAPRAEQGLERGARIFLVVDDQDLRFHRHRQSLMPTLGAIAVPGLPELDVWDLYESPGRDRGLTASWRGKNDPLFFLGPSCPEVPTR